MISQHLPIAQVLPALLGAPLCVLLRVPSLAWLLTLAATSSSLYIAGMLLLQVLHHGPVSYALGGWIAPWGIEYYVDPVNAFVCLIVAAIGTVVAIMAPTSIEKEILPEKRTLFYSAFLLCFAGLLGIAVTGDAFNLFVFLEISSLSSYALISLGADRRALTAAYQYLVMGTIGATFILIGVGLLYVMTGTLNMQDLAQRLPSVNDSRTVYSAFAFLIVGISLKMGLFPLHLWLPNAYAYAPSVVTVFLAATATKVAVYVFLRFIFSIFGQEYAFETIALGTPLSLLAIAGIFIASVTAIYQDNIKRMLAYSSVAQIGYMILGVSFASATGLTATILHLFNHALIKAALFAVLGALAYRIGSVRLSDLRGSGRVMPWTMAAFVIGGLSLIGVPLTVGFISKWYLIQAAIAEGRPLIAVAILAGSLLAAVYIWRVVEAAYFQPADTSRTIQGEAPAAILSMVWLLIAANIFFGVNTDLTIGAAEVGAGLLLGGFP